MKKKKFYFEDGKYIWIYLFKKKKKLNEVYRKKEHDPSMITDVTGASLHYEILETKKGKIIGMKRETGTVLLSIENCGAGVVAHELMHAVLWSYQHGNRGSKKYAKQYPIVIKDMEQEEAILHRFTNVIIQFYNWYWKIKSSIK